MQEEFVQIKVLSIVGKHSQTMVIHLVVKDVVVMEKKVLVCK